MRVFRLAFIAYAAAGVLAAAPGRDADVSRVKTAMGRLPLRFEANAGQWNPAARFAAHASSYTLLLTPAGPVFSLRNSHRVDMSLVGSNPAAEITGAGRAEGRTDYFVGNRSHWRSDLPAYSRVLYRDAYPGIDAAYYGNNDALEYDFILAPHADASAIRLRFEGAKRARINAKGELVVETEAGDLVQKSPYIYQEASDSAGRSVISGGYQMLADGSVSFHLGEYDHSRTLVIDPLLVYSSYVGSSGADELNAVKIGSNGWVYVVGNTTTSEILASPEGYEITNTTDGTADIFAMAFSVTGSGGLIVRYCSYIGGTSNDVPTALDVDSTGKFFITGWTTSTDYPRAGTPVQDAALGTTYDAFVTVLDPTGSGITALWYSTFLGGTDKDWGRGIAVGKDGMIYVIGTTNSIDFPITGNAYAQTMWDTQDMFLSKIDMTSSTLVYSTYLGGELSEEGRAIAVSPTGLVYFAGVTTSTQFPWAVAPYRSVLQGKTDIVFGVMDMTKDQVDSLLYATYFGGSDVDDVRKIAIDANGHVVMTGYTLSADFPITFDAMQPTPSGGGDAFVAVVDPHPGPFLLYSTFLGGSHSDVAYDVACDTAGSIYVTGYTLSPDFPVTKDAPQPGYGNGADVFVTKFKPGIAGPAALQFSTFIGGAGVHVPTGMALGNNGTLYVVGYSGVGMPSAGDSLQYYSGGLTDGFIFAISEVVGQPVKLNTLLRAAPRETRTGSAQQVPLFNRQ
jgi:hypothetical protein